MKFTDVAMQVLAEPAEGEDVLKETLAKSGATEEQIEAAIGHYRLQQGFKDQVTPELFGEVAKAAEYVVEKAKKAEMTDEEKKQMMEEEEKKKAKKPFPGAAPPFEKEKTAKSEVPEAVQKAIDEKDAEIAELRKSLDTEKATRERNDLIVEVSKSYGHVPGKSVEEMADMLLKARAAGGDLEKELREQWEQTSKAVEESALLKSGGSPLAKNFVGGAIDEMNTRAKELVNKSNGELTFDRAFVQIMDDDPALYQRYLDENPAQRQR